MAIALGLQLGLHLRDPLFLGGLRFGREYVVDFRAAFPLLQHPGECVLILLEELEWTSVKEKNRKKD